jgi:hypothetical protein
VDLFVMLHYRKGLVEGVQQSAPLLVLGRAAEALRMVPNRSHSTSSTKVFGCSRQRESVKRRKPGVPAMIALASAKADSKAASSPGLTGSRACSRITGTACLRIDHPHAGAVTRGRKRILCGRS